MKMTEDELKGKIIELLLLQAYPSYIPFIPVFCPQCERQPDLSHLPTWCVKCGSKMQAFPEIIWKNYLRKDPKFAEYERFRKCLYKENNWNAQNDPFAILGMTKDMQKWTFIHNTRKELEHKGY